MINCFGIIYLISGIAKLQAQWYNEFILETGDIVMQFEALSSPSLKEMFVDALQSAILSGEMKIGEKLPSEREFSEKMQVSRAVVNAGLNDLMDRGLIKILPRKGAYVADYYNDGNLETLNAVLDYKDVDFSDDSIRSLLEYRKLTDQLASERIIREATDEEIQGLGKWLDQLKAARGVEDTVLAAYDYYHEFCKISHDLILPLIVKSFEKSICNLWTRYCQDYGPSALVESLAKMYDYIKVRDLDGALQWASEDLDRSISGDRPVYRPGKTQD